MATEGALRVWWIPQIPMNAFYAEVSSVEEGRRLIDTLALYDLFQFENNIKPDYCNAGGLSRFEDGDWWDYNDDDLEELA